MYTYIHQCSFNVFQWRHHAAADATLAHATKANLRWPQTESDRAVLLHTPLVIDVLPQVQRAFVQQFFSTTKWAIDVARML
jgi:hypothetical protein